MFSTALPSQACDEGLCGSSRRLAEASCMLKYIMRMVLCMGCRQQVVAITCMLLELHGGVCSMQAESAELMLEGM